MNFWKKKCVLIFLRILFVFVNMGPYGSKNFKTLLLLQIAAECFQTSPEFYSQKYVWDFWNYKNWNFNDFFFFVFVNMGPNGSEHFKTLNSSYKSHPKVLKLVLNLPSNGPHKTMFGVFESLSLRFSKNVLQKFEIYHCSLWRKQKPQLSGNRAIIEQNIIQHI